MNHFLRNQSRDGNNENLAKVIVASKLELRNVLENAIRTHKAFNLVHNNNTVTVTLTKNYVEINPNPTHYRWDFKYFNNFKAEIISAISWNLFKNPSIHEIMRVSPADSQSEQFWFFDDRTCKAFYISDGKIFRNDEKRKQNYEYCITRGKDICHIDRELITEDYQLSDDDLKVISNTDVSPEDFRRFFIQQNKGQYTRSNIASDTLSKMTYKYKYFYKCYRCHKDTFSWRKHELLAFIDYAWPDYCSSCKEIVEEEKRLESERLLAEHNHRMEIDKDYRRKYEKNSIKLKPITFSSSVKENIKAKPMEKPADSHLYYPPKFNFAKTKK